MVPALLGRLLRQTLPQWHPKEAGRRNGRPTTPEHALVYQAVMRVAFRQSLQAVQGTMRLPSHRRWSHHEGVSGATLCRFMTNHESTALLEKLLAVTTWPVRRFERLVHPDGTGLTENHTEPFQHKGRPATRRHTYRYMVALWTYRYTMIAAVHSQRGAFGETPWLLPLLERARIILNVREVGGDRAYDASYVREYAESQGIDYQVIRKSRHGWGRSRANRVYREKANRRNNAEAGNHAFKGLLGDHVYSTNEVAQRNEVLCMAIAYNLMHLIQFSLDRGTQIRFHAGARYVAPEPWLSLHQSREPIRAATDP